MVKMGRIVAKLGEIRGWLAWGVAVAGLLGAAGCGNPVLGPDSVHLGMTVTQVRESMGGSGTSDPGDFSGTDGAHITEFYWNYNDIRIHFDMNQVVEIYRPDPELGIWVRTDPPKKAPTQEPDRPRSDPTPGRPVPGIRTPGR